MKTLPSKQLLSEVLKNETKGLKSFGLSECEEYIIFQYEDFDDSINIYELVHMNLKQWAKFKNVFGKIDWSEEPEQIFKKAEELRNEIS